MQDGGTSPIQRYSFQESHGDGTQDLFARVDSRGTGTDFNASILHLFLHRIFAGNVQAPTSVVEMQSITYSPPLISGVSPHIYVVLLDPVSQQLRPDRNRTPIHSNSIDQSACDDRKESESFLAQIRG